MKPEDFDLFATLVKQRSGLALTREKAYLLESRLLPVVRKYNMQSLDEMAQAIRSQRKEDMMEDVTEAMTTNESSFFRDQKPFRFFRDSVLPQLLESRAAKKQIRIWSAASSSGQEAYSLAMICEEEAEKLQGWKVDITGTDLSREMVERARNGIYTQFEVQRGLPIVMLVKYFQQLSADKWQIKEEIRRRVSFNGGNLLHDFGPTGIFDVVFCRNLFIYFDAPTRARVLDALHGVMAPDGFLFMGKGDSPLENNEQFRLLDGQRNIYSAVPRGHAAARQAG